VPGESRLKRLMSSIIPGSGKDTKIDSETAKCTEEGKAKEAKMEIVLHVINNTQNEHYIVDNEAIYVVEIRYMYAVHFAYALCRST